MKHEPEQRCASCNSAPHNWYVLDARSSRRGLAIFTEAEAQERAALLNDMVLRDTISPIFASMGAKVEGPFWARQEK